MGCVAPAVPSKLGWVPRHCWKNGVGSPLFLLFFCVVGYPPNWGKWPRYIDRMLNGEPMRGLVDTGVSVSCLSHSTWWHNRATWWALCPYHQVIRGANDQSLTFAGSTQYLRLKWGSATGPASFVVVMGLMGTLALIRMDLMVPLHVRIKAASCIATPQPVRTFQALENTSSKVTPARISTEMATQTATNTTTSSTSDTTGSALAALLQRLQVPAESARFVQEVSPWPNHTICFKPSIELPLCVSSTHILSSGSAVWVMLHSLRTEPVSLNAGHQEGTLEAVEVVEPSEDAAVASPSSLGELVHTHLSLVW